MASLGCQARFFLLWTAPLCGIDPTETLSVPGGDLAVPGQVVGPADRWPISVAIDRKTDIAEPIRYLDAAWSMPLAPITAMASGPVRN
jgi:hypothetical protein